MADQAITALPKKTYSGSSQIASTDYLLGIDSAEGYQMLIQDLGEYIINRVTASLAGSTQSLASAISALNSKQTKYTIIYGSTASVSGSIYTYPSISQAIDAIVSANGNREGRYMAECINSTSYSDTYSSIVSANSTLIIDVIGSSYINVIAITLANPTVCPLIKRTKGSGNVWSNWVGLPSRDEMNAATVKTLTVTATADANGYIDTGLNYNQAVPLCVYSVTINGSAAYPFLYEFLMRGGSPAEKIAVRIKRWNGEIYTGEITFSMKYI